MEEKEKFINQVLEDWFIEFEKDLPLIANNLEIFIDFCEYMYFTYKGIYEDLIDYNIFPIDLNGHHKSSYYENIEIIDKFFKSINKEVNINQLFVDGTIDINYLEKEEGLCSIKKGTLGISGYYDNHKSINVSSEGTVFDSIIWAHEISHYLNQNDNKTSEARELLTESVAFANEFIYLDYLEKLGYFKEATDMRLILTNIFTHILDDDYVIFRALISHSKFGEISKETYSLIFKNTDNYEKEINNLVNLIRENGIKIYTSIWYSIASALSVYMYINYRKDNLFIDKINEMDIKLNELEYWDLLKIIGINGYNKEEKEKIKEAFKDYKDILYSSISKKK